MLEHIGVGRLYDPVTDVHALLKAFQGKGEQNICFLCNSPEILNYYLMVHKVK